LPELVAGWEEWVAQLQWVAAYRSQERFLNPWSTGRTAADANNLNRRLNRALVAAGLPRFAFSPHQLRHSFATNMLRCDVPIEVIADQMAHANIETTRNYLSTQGMLRRWKRKGHG
jgi:integrase